MTLLTAPRPCELAAIRSSMFTGVARMASKVFWKVIRHVGAVGALIDRGEPWTTRR